MTAFRLALALVILSVVPNVASSEDHWVKRGVFAMSFFPELVERDANNRPIRGRYKTYRGATQERGRNAIYLPGNTIIYDAELIEPNYRRLPYRVMRGITQSGIPVVVSQNSVSTSHFKPDASREVVVHQNFYACPVINCDDAGKDLVPQATAGYRIVEEDWQNAQVITLTNASEAEFQFTPKELIELEERGVLTIHEGRKYPRFKIVEGYANWLSTGCGSARKADAMLNLTGLDPQGRDDRPLDRRDPSTWPLMSLLWDLVAIKLFQMSNVYDGDLLTLDSVTLDASPTEGTDRAVDVTVFALSDTRNVDTGTPEWVFGALMSYVRCRQAEGTTKKVLSYVEDAYFAMDRHDAYALPQQLNSSQKEAIEQIMSTDRSFMYSINSSQDHHDFFKVLVGSLPEKNNHVAAFLISRLNATCRDNGERERCDAIWDAVPKDND